MVAIHDASPALTLRAGPEALAHIRQHGLHPRDVHLIPGAAGGPKALGLQGLDLAIFGDWLARHPQPRDLMGSSIGSWRFAALAAADDPATGLRRLGELYLAQRFAPDVTAEQVSRQSGEMLEQLLAGKEKPVLEHPGYRLHVIVNRSRGLLGFDHRGLLALGLAGAVVRNLIHRPWIGASLERWILHDPRQAPPLGPMTDIPPNLAPLSAANLRAALLASASIPWVMSGVREIAGLPAGVYRDGGLTDYHLDLPYAAPGVVLYPHFTDRIIPGWFDKSLRWRRGDPRRLARVLVIAPSADYLARLSLGKLPDRRDFTAFAGDDKTRQRHWRQAMDASRRLGDEFLELAETGRWAGRMVPL